MYKRGQEMSPNQAMAFAIEIAKMGRGFVSPNPVVGCVIVDRHHKFLSAGAHLRYGGAHAEVHALSAVENPEDMEGGTLYVTLEPCSHHGNTPPCAEAIIKTQLKKVVYGTLDPNPLVAGRGIQMLQKAGKETSSFPKYEMACLRICEQFIFHIKNKRPFIALKVGSSLDGKIALSSGESQWITGEEARRQGRQLRAHYDATLIGSGTLQHDNPTLDFRGTGFEGQKNNRIVVLDPNGSQALNFKESQLYKTHGAKNIYVLTKQEFMSDWAKNLVHIIEWDASLQGWQSALQNLQQKGIYSIYAEGGSYVFGQLLQFRLAQKLYLFQSSKILGEGLSWSQAFQNQKLSEVPTLKNWTSTVVGSDRLNIAYFD